MKKLLLVLALSAVFSGVHAATGFDTSNKDTIKASGDKIIAEFNDKAKEKKFGDAMMYFSIGGPDGFKKLMAEAMSGKKTEPDEAAFFDNLKVLEGLSGDEILARYDAAVAADKAAEQVRNRRNALQKEAEQLTAKGDFDAAGAKYDELAGIEGGRAAAEKGKTDLAQARAAHDVAAAYLPKIELSGIDAGRVKFYGSGSEKLPAVRMTIRNNGDRDLRRVTVSVTFLNAEDKPIFEETFSPVNAGGFEGKPLKAGYVQEMPDGQYFKVDEPLKDWKEGNVRIAIVGMEFTDGETAGGRASRLGDSLTWKADTRHVNAGTTVKAADAMEAYKPFLKIEDLKAARKDSFTGEKQPAVRMDIRNTGDRTVKGVTVTVYFLNKEGKPFYEDDIRVVGSGDKPLKPGYVKEMKRNRYFFIEEPLKDWDEGNIKAEITRIEFAE